MEKRICVIEGDGIGPEVMAQAIKVLRKVASKYNHNFEYDYALAGGIAIDKTGKCLPDETLDKVLNSDSTLLGAVGGSKWDSQPAENRPEKALLGIRKAMQVYANLRPQKLYPQLDSPLKTEVVGSGIDIMIVRELVSGVYFGEHNQAVDSAGKYAVDIMKYTENEIERVAKVAFELAEQRKKQLLLVDKANVLATSKLWREVVSNVAKDYKDINVSYMYVDNCAMQLIKNPSKIDVILTENMFGDILSDEASALTGSIGMAGSASIGDGGRGLYEAIHGSAPDIAGKDIANPIGMILSAAMMLRSSFGLEAEAQVIENAVFKFIEEGYRTADIMQENSKLVGCSQAGDLICSFI
ncbi:MAG: 3-isopropylmalate dehydrogenase [Clostridia bacterium]|nr:3-isopropylmalate dehydrogenase [Clostridia bacterium]